MVTGAAASAQGKKGRSRSFSRLRPGRRHRRSRGRQVSKATDIAAAVIRRLATVTAEPSL
jgi:hypothetical protein